MTITPQPFYTTTEEEDPVWHDNDQCDEGQKIKKENIAYGTGGRRKCDICKDLDEKESKKLLFK